MSETLGTIRWHVTNDAILILTMDRPDSTINTMDAAWTSSMTQAMDRLESDLRRNPMSIRGVIVTSAKSTFFAGGDLGALQSVLPEDALRVRQEVDSIKRQLRRLETIGRPVVAVINGAALGGGFEVALACHYRIAVNVPGTRVGLPEVTYGLLPGGGGVTRTVRLLGMRTALKEVLLYGRRHTADDALALGIVDDLAPDAAGALARAQAWIADHPAGGQPWEADAFVPPETTSLAASPAELVSDLTGIPVAALGTPATRAQEAITATALEGAKLGFEAACGVETDHFVDLIVGPVAKNMIQGLFFDLRSVNAGLARPPAGERGTFARATLIGAGSSGADLAGRCAKAGIEVIRQDMDVALGPACLLGRLHPTNPAEGASSSELVIEAVRDNADLHHAIHERVDAVGLRFINPVEQPCILEVVRGRQTSDAVVAMAFDFARLIGMTPIVVQCSHRSFIARVILRFLEEAVGMIGDGVGPHTVELACARAGYSTGALALLDDMSLPVFRELRNEFREGREIGNESPADVIASRMVDDFDRHGRAGGHGFYDYVEGQRVGLWAGLSRHFSTYGEMWSGGLQPLEERLLFIAAVEALRCLAEGVITTEQEANVASLFGLGYPSWTGGVVRYVKQFPGGPAGFLATSSALADTHGPRFRPPAVFTSAVGPQRWRRVPPAP